MFTGDELSRMESLSRGFNFCGLNLLDTPQSSHFLTFMWVIPALCLLTSLLSQVIMMKMQPGMSQQQGCMKWMLYLMPLLTAWIAYTVPGAVGFYWTIQTTVSFVQSMLLRKFYSPALVSAKAEAQRVALREVEEARMKPLAVPLKIHAGPAPKQQKKERRLRSIHKNKRESKNRAATITGEQKNNEKRAAYQEDNRAVWSREG